MIQDSYAHAGYGGDQADKGRRRQDRRRGARPCYGRVGQIRRAEPSANDPFITHVLHSEQKAQTAYRLALSRRESTPAVIVSKAQTQTGTEPP